MDNKAKAYFALMLSREERMMPVARPPKWRYVRFIPDATYFKPVGVPLKELEEVVLAVEELEALRLKDIEGLEQEECAEKMNVSRPTFVRVINTARRKVAEALVKGYAIRIEGGNYQIVGTVRCGRCGHEWHQPETGIELACPKCLNPEQGRGGHRKGWRHRGNKLG